MVAPAAEIKRIERRVPVLPHAALLWLRPVLTSPKKRSQAIGIFDPMPAAFLGFIGVTFPFPKAVHTKPCRNVSRPKIGFYKYCVFQVAFRKLD